MLRIVTPATTEPVSIEEVKAHLRVTHDEDDDLLAAQIKAAREHIEAFTGLALVAASYAWHPEGAGRCGWRPRLPLMPADVTEVSYYDGEARVIALADDYRWDADRGALTLGTWLEPSVAFTTVPDPVPEALKAAMKLIVADLYENTEGTITGTIVARHPGLDMLMWPYRRNLGV